MAGMNNTWVDKKLMPKQGVAWFKCDEASGNVLDNKASFIGAAYNLTRVDDVEGGKALSFNGSNSYVQFNGKVLPTGSRSIYFRIKTTQTSICRVHSTIRVVASSVGEFTTMNEAAGKMGWIFADISGKGFGLYSKKSVNDGQWHEFLFTYNNETKEAKMYVDDFSEPDAQTVWNANGGGVATLNLELGRLPSPTSNWYAFSGQLDNFQVYNGVIQPFANTLLIKSNNAIYILENGIFVDRTNLFSDINNITEQEFIEYGADTQVIDGNAINSLNALDSFEVLHYTDDPNITESSIELTVPEYKLIENPEILLYTDAEEHPEDVSYIYVGSSQAETVKHDINTKFRTGIKQVLVKDNSATAPGAEIKYLVSFDNKSSYRGYRSGEWKNVSLEQIDVLGMTKTELEAITEAQWSEVFVEGIRMHFAFSLINRDIDSVAVFESLEVVFSDNKAPELTASVSSNQAGYTPTSITATAKKENQKVRYRVLLNGSPYEDWSEYLLPPLDIASSIPFDKYIDGNNVINIEVEDEFGAKYVYETSVINTARDAKITITKPIGSTSKNSPYIFPFKIEAPFYRKNLGTETASKSRIPSEAESMYSFKIERSKAQSSKIESFDLSINPPLKLIKDGAKIMTIRNDSLVDTGLASIDKQSIVEHGYAELETERMYSTTAKSSFQSSVDGSNIYSVKIPNIFSQVDSIKI